MIVAFLPTIIFGACLLGMLLLEIAHHADNHPNTIKKRALSEKHANERAVLRKELKKEKLQKKLDSL